MRIFGFSLFLVVLFRPILAHASIFQPFVDMAQDGRSAFLVVGAALVFGGLALGAGLIALGLTNMGQRLMQGVIGLAVLAGAGAAVSAISGG